MNSKLTCVSGYWEVKNKHDNKFNDWFKNTLKINNPYVFFGDSKSIELVKKYRGELPTHYIELNIDNFVTYKFKNRMITHKKHCPSIDLNLIWNEKIFLIKKASELNPFNSEFFHWVDAGISTYRNLKPPSCEFSQEKIKKLVNDKFIYSSSNKYKEERVNETSYYHHISGTYILHKNIIDNFCKIYYNYMDKLINKNNIWTDQVILTHIFKDNKNLFFKLTKGYGQITPMLY